MLDFSKPLELDYRIASFPIILYQIASFGQTIWTAASNFDGSQAVLGKFFAVVPLAFSSAAYLLFSVFLEQKKKIQ